MKTMRDDEPQLEKTNGMACHQRGYFLKKLAVFAIFTMKRWGVSFRLCRVFAGLFFQDPIQNRKLGKYYILICSIKNVLVSCL